MKREIVFPESYSIPTLLDFASNFEQICSATNSCRLTDADYDDNDRINDKNADYNADDATAGFALPQLDEAGASEHGLAARPPQVGNILSLSLQIFPW